MGIICLHEKQIHTYGELPKLGSVAPNFVATRPDLSTCSLEDFKNKALLINVYPSIDTQICFESVKNFQQSTINKQKVEVLCISMDLPFALRRVAEGEKLTGMTLLSDFRNREFGELYGLTIADGSLAGLLARAVIILDSQHHVIYHELVADIAKPPNYQQALMHLQTI